jgi:hypothetical protein
MTGAAGKSTVPFARVITYTVWASATGIYALVAAGRIDVGLSLTLQANQLLWMAVERPGAIAGGQASMNRT